jgi:hypothetical protein
MSVSEAVSPGIDRADCVDKRMPAHHLITGTALVDGEPVQHTTEFPEEGDLVYPGIVHIVNGFGGYKATSRWLRYYLAELGFITSSSTPLRVSDGMSLDDLRDSQALHAKSHEVIQRAVVENDELAHAPNSDLIDTSRKLWLPHSMGGLSVARFVDETQDKADGIVNLMAVGFGSPSLWQVLTKVPSKIPAGITKELAPYLRSDYLDVDIVNLVKIASYYGRNPLRTIGEAYSCLTEDVREKTDRIRQNGIKVGYLAAKYDCLVPADDSIANYVDDYRVLINAGHLAPQLKPKLVAEAATELILNKWGLGY